MSRRLAARICLTRLAAPMGGAKKAGLTIKACLLSGVLLAACPFASALDPALDVSQYAHTSWKIRDGFPKGDVLAIAQNHDGYLWLGTDLGLFRYDGAGTIPRHPPQGQILPSEGVLSLLLARDGTIWLGTLKGGLVSWKDSKLTQYPELAGDDIMSLIEDRDGTVWAAAWASTHPGKLCAIRDAEIHCYGDNGSFGDGPISLYEDRNGTLWVGTYTGVWQWKPGAPQFYSLPADLDGIQGFAEDDGGLLIALGTRVVRLDHGKLQTAYVNPPGVRRSIKLLRDHDGGLWIGTADQGLIHVHQGRMDTYSQVDGLSGNVIMNLFEDRESNVWVATHAGLDRFRDHAVVTLSAKQGLPNVSGESILAARDGSIWVSTTDGLARWTQGVVRRFIGSGLTARTSLFEDHGGRIWVAGHDRVGYFENDRFVPVNGVPAGWVYAMAEDQDANLWIANLDRGLLELRGDRLAQQIPWTKFGEHGYALALAADRSQNGLWVGLSEGGIAHVRGDQILSFYGAAEGLGNGAVNGLQFDHEGTLWAATASGLSRLKDGRIATLSSQNGLPCDVVNWVMEDDDQSLWLYMPCGLVRIARTELEAWASNPGRTIQLAVLDSSDGVRTRGSFDNIGPNVAKAPDGKIWFTTFDGLSVIDPTHLPFNKLPPPVNIERIVADGKSYDVSNGLRLPPSVRDLMIDYTALSLAVPEKIHFRYKLEGQDKDWRELVNVRHVEYTNLPPKHYKFRVLACNNSGVWNEEGAALDFVIPPAWFQTNWFRALCVVFFSVFLWGLHRLRIQHIRREERKLREVTETIPAMAWMAEPDGKVRFVNRRWMEYIGVSDIQNPDEVWRTALHPEDRERIERRWSASLGSGEPFEEELRFRHTNGEYRWFLSRAVPLRDRRGNILKWCGVSADIEDRKRAEQLQADLAHTNRVTMLGELAASISHELKQPITATMTNARVSMRWLTREHPDLDEVFQAAQRIEKDGARATEIIDRLRALYKKTPPKHEPVDVNEIIGEMVVMLRGEADRFAVSIRTDLAANLPRIAADRVQLQQVLMNLMLNAIEAMNETGGVLTISSRSENQHLVISVSDTGVGLPSGKADKIFDAFFTTKPQGSGMGLAISRSIVESHGGRLWATPNDGRGASFHFSLLAAAQPAEKANSQEQEIPPISG